MSLLILPFLAFAIAITVLSASKIDLLVTLEAVLAEPHCYIACCHDLCAHEIRNNTIVELHLFDSKFFLADVTAFGNRKLFVHSPNVA
jgi:hypothetical protein